MCGFYFISAGGDVPLLYSPDPKSNTALGIKVVHEDSRIPGSLHSSIFILTLAAKKTQSKLLNPSWAVPQGSVFAIWWRELSRHKISTSTSPDKVSLAGSDGLKQLLPPSKARLASPGYPDLHSRLWNSGNCGIKWRGSGTAVNLWKSRAPGPLPDAGGGPSALRTAC